MFLLILCSIKIERLLFLKFLKILAFFDSYFWPFNKTHEKIIAIFVISAIIASICRAVARSENPGGHVVLGGDNVPPLVEIGLADLPKSGGARAPPAPPLATGLSSKGETLLSVNH